MTLRKAVLIGTKTLISALLIRFLFMGVEWREVIAALRRIGFPQFTAALLLFIASLFASTLKWRALLAPFRSSATLFELFELNMISAFYEFFLPGGQFTGQAVKAYKTTRLSGDTTQYVMSILVDRVTGLIPFVLLGFVALLRSPSYETIPGAVFGAYAFLLAASLAALLLWAPGIGLPLARNVEAFLARSDHPKVRVFIRKPLAAIALYCGEYRVLGSALLLGGIFQALNTGVVFTMARVQGVVLPFSDFLWIYVLVSLVLFIPATIMGLGQRELSFVYLLGAVGVSSVTAVGVSFSVFLVIAAAGLIGGLIEAYRVFGNRKKTLLVFGADGLLGGELVEHFSNDGGYRVVAATKADADVRNLEEVRALIRREAPDWVINAAAAIDVEWCEKHPDEAMRINADGARNIARVAKELPVSGGFIQISTSDVFGAGDVPHREDEEPKPVNEYGRTKLKGERLVAAGLERSGVRYFIVRTSWLYGRRRETFVDMAAASLRAGREFSAIADQFNVPTWTRDLSRAIGRLIVSSRSYTSGVYHLAADALQAAVSKYDIAREIGDIVGAAPGLVRRGERGVLLGAPRPSRAELENTKFPRLPSWRASLREYLSARYGRIG